MFSFAYIWVFLLLPLPWLVSRPGRPWLEERPAIKTPFFAELVELSGQKPESGVIVRQPPLPVRILTVCCWLLLVIAAARPQWIEPPLVKQIPTRDLLLGIDLSGSMRIDDFISREGLKVSRLAAVKEVVDDFLRRRRGDRIGLIFFGSAPYIQAPFTEDLKLCRELLIEAQVGMAGPRTALGDTIGLAINMFRESEVKDKLLIVLTDGNDTGSKVEPVEAARIAADNNIVIYCVAVGDPRTAGEEKLDEKTLQDVARSTGGYFFRAADRAELEKIYHKIDQLSTHKIETISYRPKLDLYYWPLGLVMILTLFLHIVRIGGRVRLRLLPESPR